MGQRIGCGTVDETDMYEQGYGGGICIEEPQVPEKDGFAHEGQACIIVYTMRRWRIASSQRGQGVQVKTRMSHVQSCTDDNGLWSYRLFWSDRGRGPWTSCLCC